MRYAMPGLVKVYTAEESIWKEDLLSYTKIEPIHSLTKLLRHRRIIRVRC